ncbi:hypothetical protein ACLKA6_015968 [Drosophila palustris]
MILIILLKTPLHEGDGEQEEGNMVVGLQLVRDTAEHLRANAADSNEDMQIKAARWPKPQKNQRQCGKITMSITRHII